MVGDYKWMTYGEAATTRSAIGSGLVSHGIPKEIETAPYSASMQFSLGADTDEAKVYFDKATDYFQQAVDQDGGNELYLKSLEVAAKDL